MKILTKLMGSGTSGQVLTKIGKDNFGWANATGGGSTADIHRIPDLQNVLFCKLYHKYFVVHSIGYGIGYNYKVSEVSKPAGITGDYAFDSTSGFNFAYAEDATTYTITFISVTNTNNRITYKFNISDDSFVSEIFVYTGGEYTITSEADINTVTLVGEIYYTTNVIRF